MAAQRAEKVSISMPAPLVKAVRKHVGPRGLSGFAARAFQQQLEREQLRAYLDELDAELGPVPKEIMDEVRAAWPKR
jgi:hypothetical protein